MGFGLGSKSYYAEFGGYVYQFEDKRTRDLMCKGGNPISAALADRVCYTGRVTIPHLTSCEHKPKKLTR